MYNIIKLYQERREAVIFLQYFTAIMMNNKYPKKIAILCLSAIIGLSAAVIPTLPMSLDVSAATNISSVQSATTNLVITGITKNTDKTIGISVRLPKSKNKHYILYRLQYKPTGEFQWKRIHNFTANGTTRNYQYTDKSPVNTVKSGTAEYVYGLKEVGTDIMYKFFSQPLSVSMQYDKNTGDITLKWNKKESIKTHYQVFYRGADNNDVIVGTTTGNSFTIKNAVHQGTTNKKYTYYVRCVSKENSKVVQSPVASKTGIYSRPYVLTGISVKSDSIGTYLQWNAFKTGARYRVEKKIGNQWQVIGTTYRTIFEDVNLNSGTTYQYRVYAIDNNENRLTDYFNTSVIFRPIQIKDMIIGKTIRISGGDQNAPGNNGVAKAVLYKDRNAQTKLTELSDDTKAIVTDVYYVNNNPAASRFKVKVNGREGWVKMNYCLIKVQDVIPSINVSLSYASKTPFTNSKIADLNELTQLNMFHYKNNTNIIVGLADKPLYSKNEAWLRFDTVHKLANAQKQFLKEGYCIKLYDAFRPVKVTISTDKAWDVYVNKYIPVSERANLWRQIANYSIHNWGGAVDMTLTRTNDGMEVKTQTYMHDLSFDSKVANNNIEANRMKRIMTSSGFETYSGEWWHFQDNVGVSNQVFYKNINL